MAGGGWWVPRVLVGLLWAASFSSCFNLEPRTGRLYSYPYASTQGRKSYFGFSVALQHNIVENTTWVIVGAPRANSSLYDSTQISEPGALFKCDLTGDTCEEVIVDKTGNTEVITIKAEFSYHDLKNHGWLGGSLDSQPLWQEDRQVTGVCAPLWKNQIAEPKQHMNGVCYWIDDSVPGATAQKELPLVNHRKQRGNRFYAYGQAGMSIHFPEDQTKFIIGAPGVNFWRGSVILFEDNPRDIGKRPPSQRQKQMFTRNQECISSSHTEYHDLFGYSVISGRFLSQDQVLYAAGAPKGSDSIGKVLVFDFPSSRTEVLTEREFKGEQLGAYFGAALAAADINGDGLTDLVVGSPMYSLRGLNDVGRIQTFLSARGQGLHIRPGPHYGKKVSLARFGTSLASAGDLNADNYQDIVVGAPWEGSGAVYVFLGSIDGLNQQYSQRLSPEDFTPSGLQGFGMAMSRGIDIDNNGYPDVAIGSFLSGHVAVVKTRPVAALSGQVIANPPNVPWEGRTALNLTTCFHYTGKRIPKSCSIRVTLALDHSSPLSRASFTDNSYILSFNETLVANSPQPVCRTDHVTVKENKGDPDQPLDMKLEYELESIPGKELTQQPMTKPGSKHSSTAQVGILKGCAEKICKVDMMLKADPDIGQDKKLVVGEKTKLELLVNVTNKAEPVYLPIMNVTVSPPLTLMLPRLDDCSFLDAALKTSLRCSLSNPISNGSLDSLKVNVDVSQLTDSSSDKWIQVDVAGEGEELNPLDNRFNISLPLKSYASLDLYGNSVDEQVFYEHVGDNNINATVNPSFIHTYMVTKKGPTPLDLVDLIIDIPVIITGGQKLIKLYPMKVDFLHQPFHCNLSSGSFDADISDGVEQDGGTASLGSDDSGSHDLKPNRGPITVSADKGGEETRYFNCSSSHVICTQLYCRIYNWPADTKSAAVSLKLEVDLSVMAKHMSVKGGALLTTSATASIQPLQAPPNFIGIRVASEEVVTQIRPGNLLAERVSLWVILLAVLGGILLLGLLSFGLFKAGFFRREKMEKMKAEREDIKSKLIVPDN